MDDLVRRAKEYLKSAEGLGHLNAGIPIEDLKALIEKASGK